MNDNQFMFWLKGYLLGAKEIDRQVILRTMEEVLKEKQPSVYRGLRGLPNGYLNGEIHANN